MSILIGLTGPTGAGKSSVLGIAKELGIKVVDCDKVARKAVEKGTKGLEAVVKAFGFSVLNADGTLNRKALANLAFSSEENTEKLNRTLLPYISEMVKSEIDCEKVLLDAPTLFESGMNSICDSVIAVLADRKKRIERIMARDNIGEEEALLRVKAGKSDDFYQQRANYIIYNNEKVEDYISDIKKILIEIFGG